MINKIMHPQEVEVWYVIPSLRKEITLNLIKRKFEQKRIASILGITEAAVSQYAHKKRAGGIIFNKEVKKIIKDAADRIVSNNAVAFKEIQNMLKTPELSEIKCSIHKKEGHALKECRICSE